MKLPRKLKIKRSTWQVKFDESIEKTDDAVGLCVFSSKKILISPNQDSNDLADTLLHEILHAIWPTDLCGDKLEEKLVARLAGSLLQILQDNKLKFKKKIKHK